MQFSKKVRVAKCVTLASLIPVLLWAHSGGPDVRNTGAPGDNTCAQSSCHIGTTVNANGNKVTLEFEGGANYKPGVKQKVTVTVSEPSRIYGFQATARLGSNLQKGQAGTFTAGTQQLVLCDDGTERKAAGCPSSSSVEFVEHGAPNSTGVFTFDWTPPATDVGEIKFYVAANAANGNGQADRLDKIYTSSATLTAGAATTGPKPAITSGGVSDAFTGQAGTAANTWTAIYGTNLAANTKQWDENFPGGQLPTSIDGVSVTVNGKAAPIYFVSPGQVNIIGPADDATGDVAVVITNANGASTPVTARKSAVLPSLYAPFGADGKLYATVVDNGTGDLLGKVGVEPRAKRAVKPGDIVQIYASGLGATNPAQAPDKVVTGTPALAAPVTVRVGNATAEVFGTVLRFSALYQIGVRIPDVPDGDQPFTVTVNGVTSGSNVLLSVKR